MLKKTASRVALGALLLTASNVSAQTGIRPPQGWSLGLMAGAAAFSDMQRSSMTVLRETSAGTESRDLGRRVGAETSAALGAYLSFWPSRNWGVRLSGTYAPSRFETIMRGSHADLVVEPDSSRLAGLNVVTADLQFMFRLPTIKNRVLIYGIVGGGLARYETRRGDEPIPEEAESDLGGGPRTHPGGMFGLGAMLPFKQRAFRLHFELTDHVNRTPLASDDQSAGQSTVSLTNAVRFMVGASWSPKH